MTLRDRILSIAARRAPDFVIGGDADPYLLRWWVIPRNRFFNVYLHCFKRSDDDRALHDHPWLFNCSWLLAGRYIEHTVGGRTERRAGAWKFRWGSAAHRIELLTIADFVTSLPDDKTPVSCWTLFITGPRVRQWGFLCPRGWVHWRDFTAPDDKGATGNGCAQ